MVFLKHDNISQDLEVTVMESGVSSPSRQKPVIGSHHEPVESSIYVHKIFIQDLFSITLLSMPPPPDSSLSVKLKDQYFVRIYVVFMGIHSHTSRCN
jgi:hypothetical protein